MKVTSLEGNTQRLDGGAMFGNCPRAVWERWCPPDDQHRIALACRSMLVEEDGGRRILFEAGIGAFFEPKLRERYGVQESEHVLLRSLEQVGLRPSDVDVIVLSHLHFDHAGGLLLPWQATEPARLAFPQAQVVVSEEAWSRAKKPHPRDRASFIEALPRLLEDAGRLEVVPPGSETSVVLGSGYRLHYSHGHTPGLMLTEVAGPTGSVCFMGDLVPGVPWVHLPITMGYDRFPEQVIDEKSALLADLAQRGVWLFYTHDPQVAASRVTRDEKGRMAAIDTMAHVAMQI